jgi:AcrR family transcriptional regulator
MKRRPYRLGQRRATVEETRARIVTAAHGLLAAPTGLAAFTIDTVAAEAGVARMTIYNQFGSKMGLLEALFDHLAARGLLDRLRAAFVQPDPRAALTGLIAAFGGFWNSDRVVLRRIRALAVIDAEFAAAVMARDERRRAALRTILDRYAEEYGKPAAAACDQAVDILHTLTSFETFDQLAGATRSPEDVVPMVSRLARAVLELDAVQ